MNSTNTSPQPYLIRAIHEWCGDQGLTPYVVVHVDGNVVVPEGYARDGQIVLNLAAHATNQLSIGNDAISFQARFGGTPHDLWIPYANVLAIYARESGRGLAFSQGVAFELNPSAEGDEDEEGEDASAQTLQEDDAGSSDDDPPAGGRGGRGGHLKVIK